MVVMRVGKPCSGEWESQELETSRQSLIDSLKEESGVTASVGLTLAAAGSGQYSADPAIPPSHSGRP